MLMIKIHSDEDYNQLSKNLIVAYLWVTNPKYESQQKYRKNAQNSL